MTKLIFSELHHGSEIDDPELKLKKKHGIYIWGFVYEKCKDGNLGEPKDFKKHKKPEFIKDSMVFIPYYVGFAKGESIERRLESHHKVPNTFLRLSEPFYKRFFRHKELINLNQKKRDEWIAKQSTQEFVYISKLTIMRELYKNHGVSWPAKKSTTFPEIKKLLPKLDDTLGKLISKNQMNNFWFSFADVEEDNRNCLLYLESLTFWALKGVTISKIALCHRTLQESSFRIDDYCLYDQGVDVFKKDITGKIVANDCFPGYC